MQKASLLILMILGFTCANSQNVTDISMINPPKEYENIHIHKLDSDKNTTSFVIWVKKYVKAHKHEYHTETLYVLEGEGKMFIGEKEFAIKKGDYINVPENTVHSVRVSSKSPLKVISVQAPEFLGKDRIFVE